MTDKTAPVPAGYTSLTPYLVVRGGDKAIDFYQRAFGAVLKSRMADGDPGTVLHAELRFGDCMLTLSDEMPEMGFRAPDGGDRTGSLQFYTPDVDAVFAAAIAAGATEVSAPEDSFFGDRMAVVIDPFGHRWALCTHIEDVSDEEIERRAAELFGG